MTISDHKEILFYMRLRIEERDLPLVAEESGAF